MRLVAGPVDRGPAGVVSATVTSVDELKLAVPIVDALNRISACATVPVRCTTTGMTGSLTIRTRI
ncbi:hypothetical protein [Kutzneria sp. NPDC051319]|uniref:hypothetical protein n=1 Tax=Kutzneria sp. NPDC051319 TaxID=3155047 RepID=UPI00341E04CF